MLADAIPERVFESSKGQFQQIHVAERFQILPCASAHEVRPQ